MLDIKGQIPVLPKSGTLEVPILHIHHLSILLFLLAPATLPQELPSVIQLSPRGGPIILCHNQGVPDTNPQVPTLPHTHPLPLECTLGILWFLVWLAQEW